MTTDDEVICDESSRCPLAFGFVQKDAALAIDDRIVSHGDPLHHLVAVILPPRGLFPTKDGECGIPSQAIQAFEVVIDNHMMAIGNPDASGVLRSVANEEVALHSSVVSVA